MKGVRDATVDRDIVSAKFVKDVKVSGGHVSFTVEQAIHGAATRQQVGEQAGAAGKDLAPIDDVVKALGSLANEKNLQNPAGLNELYSTAVQKFKALEFEIRKRVDTTNGQLFLSGSEDVPPSFKSLIEEYYRTLAKKGGK